MLDGGFLKVRRDRVRLPDGTSAFREYIVHPGAVMIVPLLADGRLVLERQYRHPMGQVMLEFPAGKKDPLESALACAQRELREETGYVASEWAHVGVLHNAIAYSTEGIDVFLARGLIAGPQELDPGEFVEPVLMTAEELDCACAEGRVTDAKTLIGLMWLQKVNQGQWPVNWIVSPSARP
ncbi:NUDIX domain-containing protein [Inhella gelatinilytica]|uniref:GDP-mannose pyrophosphatase n=1 Tax=Inhella gelatinilytica TaxID=2795030 RepID=A0A931J1L6_9BURK|nr:NUDIX hydrolase [Inhella gelatinilytica]MBH9553838.1 NUDIX hydrolase [Inhella gelatinilytica]